MKLASVGLWLRDRIPGSRWLVIGVPYAWMLLFFAVPFIIVLKISFAKAMIAMPPYSDLVDWTGNIVNIKLNIQNYLFLLSDSLYASAYLSSLKIAVISTFLCLLIGYPMAYAIARMDTASRNIMIMLVVLPSWTSFLIRIYAWIGILKNNGLLNNLLMWIGIIDEPLQILYTPAAIYIGIVYAYLPFMVLPLYSNLVKLDLRLLEAASDLGAKPHTIFWRVTLPMSKAGIIAGSMLVLISVVAVSLKKKMLGDPKTLMIGRVLWQEFFNNRDWPVASAVAIVMLILLLIPILVFHHYQSKELEGKLS